MHWRQARTWRRRSAARCTPAQSRFCQHGKEQPLLLQARAGLVLGQALLARAGGLEVVLIQMLGPEKGKELYAPIAWMRRVRTQLGELGAEEVASKAEGALGGIREAGSRGLDAIKGKLGLGRPEKVAEPAPQ